jgi:hypothetical protein
MRSHYLIRDVQLSPAGTPQLHCLEIPGDMLFYAPHQHVQPVYDILA